MAYRIAPLVTTDGAQDGRRLEGLRDEGDVSQVARHFAWPRGGHERERDSHLQERGRQPEALAVGDINVEQREIEPFAKVLPGLRERVKYADDLVPLTLDD